MYVLKPELQVREGLYYNPYFTGGAIAMPKMLADGGTEYDDGTIATESQQAKVLSCTCTPSCCALLRFLRSKSPAGHHHLPGVGSRARA